jgi:calcineurin-like phosphoesterase
MKKEIILERFWSQRPQPFKVAAQNIQLQGVLLTIDPGGRCREVTRLILPLKS